MQVCVVFGKSLNAYEDLSFEAYLLKRSDISFKIFANVPQSCLVAECGTKICCAKIIDESIKKSDYKRFSGN